MKPVRTMAFVGVPDTIVLRIRQQIGRVADRLDHRWEWVGADSPDVLIVDPDSDAGLMARGRAKVLGMRCIEVCDAEGAPGDAPTLQLPIKQEALIALLNEAGTTTVSTGQLAHQDAADFYFSDLGDSDPSAKPAAPSKAEPVASLDDLLLQTGLDEEDSRKVSFRADAEIEAVDDTITSRRRQRLDESTDRGLEVDASADAAPVHRVTAERPALSTKPVEVEPPGPKPSDDGRLRLLDEKAPPTAGWPLPHFLGSDGPTRPSLHQIEGSPTLYIDPKTRSFHAEGDLSLLEPYCLRALPSDGWKPLNSAQLKDMQALPARPWSQLLWLHAWLNGDGRLASALDPGGSYRVRQRMEIAPGFHKHHGIVAQMMTPARLHEIASGAGVSMDAVFNLVNAYHSVDALDWSRRPPREPIAEPSGERGGLLSKLWPFGRR